MNILKKIKEDKGAANTVSFMVVMLFIMTLLISFIDVGLFFNTKNTMQAAAENGARNVALYGGMDNALTAQLKPKSPIEVVRDSIPQNFRSTDKNARVKILDIKCSPESGSINAGDEVFCEVQYSYKSIAGKLGLFNIGRDSAVTTVLGTSVSEVTIDK